MSQSVHQTPSQMRGICDCGQDAARDRHLVSHAGGGRSAEGSHIDRRWGFLEGEGNVQAMWDTSLENVLAFVVAVDQSCLPPSPPPVRQDVPPHRWEAARGMDGHMV